MTRLNVRAMGLLALALALPAGPAPAGPITYTITDHPGLQAGSHVVGTITTDGTIGPITAANILSWSLYLISPQGAPFHFSSADPGADSPIPGAGPSPVTATAAALTYAPDTTANNFLFHLGGHHIQAGLPALEGYLLNRDRIFSSIFSYQGVPQGVTGSGLWIGTITPGEFEIASVQPTAVPEPASLALLGAGVVTAGLWGWRRRRAASA